MPGHALKMDGVLLEIQLSPTGGSELATKGSFDENWPLWMYHALSLGYPDPFPPHLNILTQAHTGM